MKRTMSNLNVKKKISVKAVLFGCIFLCPALISSHSASAMIEVYMNPNLSNSEVIEKIEDQEEKEKQYNNLEFLEERAKIADQFMKGRPLTNVIWKFDSPNENNIGDYYIGNYPKEEFIEEYNGICQEYKNRIDHLIDKVPNQSSKEFTIPKREYELDIYTKFSLLQKKVDQYNQQ